MTEDVSFPISVEDRKSLLIDPGLPEALRSALTTAPEIKEGKHGFEFSFYEVGLPKDLADELHEHTKRLGLQKATSNLKQELDGFKSRQRGQGAS